MRETGEITATIGLTGDKLYQQRARQTLPILIRQAKAEQPISYSDLAEELTMPNPRNLNYVLGAIGNALLEITTQWQPSIPAIQALVINKSTKLPGEGISWFIANAAEFRAASNKQRRQIIDIMLRDVYRFPYWDEVLHHFGLIPLPPAIDNTSPLLIPIGDSELGESIQHRRLKEFIANHPQVIGLPPTCGSGEIEFLFRSADAVDILFRNGTEWIGVEVKSQRSSIEDIARGLFQCVKYHALLEATQKVEQAPINARVVLVLESNLPTSLIRVRNTLGIEVYQNISPS